jgi:nitric oxide reductase subunit C
MTFHAWMARAACTVLIAAPLLAVPRPARSAGADGKKLFAEKACVACHAVGAPSQGLGPELTQVSYQRSREWLLAWLTNPQKIKKDTIMPKPVWGSQEETEAVIDFLLAARRPIPAADSANGEKLFADYTCSSCHAVHKKGGKPQFPDLWEESKRHDAAWLDKWLANPQAVKPGTFMATFPLTPVQRHALVEYIASLKK